MGYLTPNEYEARHSRETSPHSPKSGPPNGVNPNGTDVWVTNVGDNTVSEILASTGAVIKTIAVGNAPGGVSSDGTHAWVTNQLDSTVTEIATYSCASGLTAHVLSASYPTGTFTGLFCVNARGSAPTPRGACRGSARSFTVKGMTTIEALGKSLALAGATNGTKNGFVELAPVQAIGTFTLN